MLVALTLDDAKLLKRGDILYETNSLSRNADYTPRRWKVNGEVKTWKTDPIRIRVPLKHGLYSYDAITESDFNEKGVCDKLAIEVMTG
jgi:hypothetical protein